VFDGMVNVVVVVVVLGAVFITTCLMFVIDDDDLNDGNDERNKNETNKIIEPIIIMKLPVVAHDIMMFLLIYNLFNEAISPSPSSCFLWCVLDYGLATFSREGNVTSSSPFSCVHKEILYVSE
jgi:hypothetical protein